VAFGPAEVRSRLDQLGDLLTPMRTHAQHLP
jgi:hypothetical protein